MLKFYIQHGMIVNKVPNIISFKQSKLLEKKVSFSTQRRNLARNDFENDFCKLLKNSFYGKSMQNVWNRVKIELFKKHNKNEIIKYQSKLTFNGIH